MLEDQAILMLICCIFGAVCWGVIRDLMKPRKPAATLDDTHRVGIPTPPAGPPLTYYRPTPQQDQTDIELENLIRVLEMAREMRQGGPRR